MKGWQNKWFESPISFTRFLFSCCCCCCCCCSFICLLYFVFDFRVTTALNLICKCNEGTRRRKTPTLIEFSPGSSPNSHYTFCRRGRKNRNKSRNQRFCFNILCRFSIQLRNPIRRVTNNRSLLDGFTASSIAHTSRSSSYAF